MSKHYFFLLIFLMLATPSFGQQKLSEKFKQHNGRAKNKMLTISISALDVSRLKKEYASVLQVLSENTLSNTCTARSSMSTIEKLQRDANVLFIDIVNAPHEEADADFSNLSLNRIHKAQHFFSELNGRDERISIKEKSFDPRNIDLLNRSFTTIVTPSEQTQHATAMATFIAGAGNSSEKSLGVVPAAALTSSDFDNLLPDQDSIFVNRSIHLQNHSYGVSIENYYGNEAAAYDQQVQRYPWLLHVFSAGNIGTTNPTSGAYKNVNVSNLSGNFKQAKNVLVVTAIDTSLHANALNSRGPAYDGRLKPDFAAYGHGGTSDAAALTTGVVAMIQQAYQQQTHVLPSASMVKALLMATSRDIENDGIDYTSGYGSIDAHRAITAVKEGDFVTTSLSSQQEKQFDVIVPEGTKRILIAVAWNDVAAMPNANRALVHDIDAYLIGGDIRFDPWVLSSYPELDSLSALPKRKPDHDNNAELITIDDPSPGTYQLHVSAHALSTSTQEVSIVTFKDDGAFSWDFPLADDVVEGSTQQKLYWSGVTESTGTISIQLNNGDWTTLFDHVALRDNVTWNAPDTLASAQLKMTIDGVDHFSGVFIISPRPKVSVPYYCTNDFALSWKAISLSENYQLFTMGDKYLEEADVVGDTLVVLPRSDHDYIAVAPMYHGKSGLRSETINAQEQGAQCYINLFSATRTDRDKVRVELRLSTTFHVQDVKAFRMIGEHSTIALQQNNLSQANDVIWFDNALQPGVSHYQAEVQLTDGRKIVSEIVDVTIEEEGKAILFPNPIDNTSELKILSGGVGVIAIFDVHGRMVIEKQLSATTETLYVDQLTPGLYIYQLRFNGKVTDGGRLLKL